jgi:hypothetical protein
MPGNAVDLAVDVGRRDRHQAVGKHFGLRHHAARQHHRILRWLQPQVVAHRDRRQQQPHRFRQALAHALDALGQRLAVRLVDQPDQLVAQRHLQLLHHRQAVPVQVRRAVVAQRGFDRVEVGGVRLGHPAQQFPPHIRQHQRERARTSAMACPAPGQDQHHAGGAEHHLRRGQHLAADLLLEVARIRNTGDQDRGRGRQQQRRNLRDQAVTDGQQRILLEGVAERHVLHQRADGDAADHVDDQDQDTGDRIAAHELGGAVHGAVEVRFGGHVLAARLGLFLVDQAGVQVGVDRHLLARQRVQREARRHFRNTLGTLGHHHEVDDHQDHEHHDTDHVVAADDDLTEGLDHLAGRGRALVAVQQHHAGRRHVQCQAHHGGGQDHGREHREVQRPLGRDRDQDHDQRQHDVEREHHVQQHRRQRQDDHRQDHQQECRRGELVATRFCDQPVQKIHDCLTSLMDVGTTTSFG